MLHHRLLILLGLGLFACNGEQPTDTNPGDADTDADSDSDTDTEVSDDEMAGAQEVEFEDGFFAAEDDLDDAGDRDFYKFEALTGDEFVVYAMGSTGGEGEPDTVIRVYDPSEALIGENDDLPFRINGTDGGYVFRAREDGVYYAEVLEWADWYGDPPQGGSGYDYTFAILQNATPEINEDGADYDNDTVVQELANIDGEAYSFYRDPWSTLLDSDTVYYYWATGDLKDATDVDTFGIRYDYTDTTTTEFSPGMISYGMFPNVDSDLDAEFELYDASGTFITSTEDVDVRTSGVGIDYDIGIMIPVMQAGDYYLQVKNTGTSSGPLAWYALFANAVPYNLEVVTYHDVPSASEADHADATDAIMTESTGTPGAYYGFLLGNLEDLSDDFDSFRLTGGVTAGNFVYVDCATTANGSQAHVHVDLVDQNGVVLDTADGRPDHVDPNFSYDDDPLLVEYEIAAGVTDLYAVITRDAANTAVGNGAYYTCYVQSDETDDSADF